ncbi:uncharacterized protein TNCV_3751051 [Trichonephila clavipes]|uniref:Uncharacterized protein n=1 Tax=Trichonephila clavipes TaxID=2585209 RepID=A0A8X6RBZ6_TRICX|nr:uncharacterized protein TNCV_3751051 [Trichonephila clavipes]
MLVQDSPRGLVAESRVRTRHKGEESNPAGAVEQGGISFELLLGKPCGRSTERDVIPRKLALIRNYGGPPKIKSPTQLLKGVKCFPVPIELTWEHNILVLKPFPCLHDGNEVDDWMSFDEWRTVGSNLKSETRTGAKIL